MPDTHRVLNAAEHVSPLYLGDAASRTLGNSVREVHSTPGATGDNALVLPGCGETPLHSCITVLQHGSVNNTTINDCGAEQLTLGEITLGNEGDAVTVMNMGICWGQIWTNVGN